MLDHEYDVKENRNVSKTKLDRVSQNASKVASAKARVDNKLSEGEDTACDIEQDLMDVPAYGRLLFIVLPDLRDVFDDLRFTLVSREAGIG